jgi:hypothetical protein
MTNHHDVPGQFPALVWAVIFTMLVHPASANPSGWGAHYSFELTRRAPGKHPRKMASAAGRNGRASPCAGGHNDGAEFWAFNATIPRLSRTSKLTRACVILRFV